MFQPFALPGNLPTPCVVVDLPRVRANIDRISKAMTERRVHWRPHAKTHKSTTIGRMQLAAGARGITLATIDEAEAFVDAGFEDIFLAYTVWPSGANIDRLRALAAKARIAVGVDSVEGARHLGDTMHGVKLEVLVEINSGANRCGVQPRDAADIADAAKQSGLKVIGAFTHGGHSYFGEEFVQDAAEDERRSLQEAAEVMRGRGHDPRVLSAGSSPTAMHSSRAPVTEERPGSDVFFDLDQIAVGTCTPSQVALVVVANVVSTAGKPGQFVMNAGSKVLGLNPPAPPYKGYGSIIEHPEAVVHALSEEHGLVHSDAPVRVGDVVSIIPNHVCPVVNLATELVVVEGGNVVDTWRIDARDRRVLFSF